MYAQNKLSVIASSGLVRDINNTEAPSLHDFPVEILVHTFALAAEPRPSHENLNGYLEWIPTTCHVCRRWRSIAISTPLLWSTIVNTGRSQDCLWVPLMLERAAGVPLDVLVDIWAERAQTVREALESLLPHSSTFRSVLLKFDYFERYDGDDEFLPRLVSRFLAQMTDIVELHLFHRQNRTSGPFALDATTFNRSGHLCHLVLDRVYLLPWSSPAYTSLRTLRLYEVSSPPTMDELLDILYACPRLEQLKIDRCDFPLNQAVSSSNAAVALPYMQDIHISGHCSRSLAHLVDRIEVSSGCKKISVFYELRTRDGVDANQPYSYLLPEATLFQSFLPQCETLSFTSWAYPVTSFVAHGPTGSETEMALGIWPKDFDPPPLSLVAWNAMLRPLANLSASSLLHLEIVYHSLKDFTEDVWAVALGNFPRLQSLRVKQETSTEARPIDNNDILRVAAALRRAYPGSEPCARRLAKLAFACAMAVDDGFVEPLVQMLEWRAEKGAAPLDYLILEWKENGRQFENILEWHENASRHKHETLVSTLQERVEKLGVTVLTTLD